MTDDETRAAVNFLADAIEYLQGRDGHAPDPDAALDAIEEAQEQIKPRKHNC